jgi:hypothetical protein
MDKEIHPNGKGGNLGTSLTPNILGQKKRLQFY